MTDSQAACTPRGSHELLSPTVVDVCSDHMQAHQSAVSSVKGNHQLLWPTPRRSRQLHWCYESRSLMHHHAGFTLTLFVRAPGMSMAAYIKGYSPMQFHTAVKTWFTWKGSSAFILHTTNRQMLVFTVCMTCSCSAGFCTVVHGTICHTNTTILMLPSPAPWLSYFTQFTMYWDALNAGRFLKGDGCCKHRCSMRGHPG